MPRSRLQNSGFFDVPEMMVNEAVDAYQHNAPVRRQGGGESATLSCTAVREAIDDAIASADGVAAHPEQCFARCEAKAGGARRWREEGVRAAHRMAADCSDDLNVRTS